MRSVALVVCGTAVVITYAVTGGLGLAILGGVLILFGLGGMAASL